MNSEFSVAVHSLVLLAHRPDHMATSDLIACNVNTHPARIRKIMGWLKRSGMIETKEGIGGGYVLVGIPDEIRLSDVYKIVSMGSLKPNWCSGNPEEDCLVSCNMEKVMNGIFYNAELQLLRYLESLTIASVLEEVRRADGKQQEADQA